MSDLSTGRGVGFACEKTVHNITQNSLIQMQYFSCANVKIENRYCISNSHTIKSLFLCGENINSM
jgi:hypothetical protein